jgi:molybdopterin-guanine dinucleotide biosynthesis protein A
VSTDRTASPLIGVVLAGGLSRRMGSDKGALELEGRTLVERALMLLEPFSESVCVSIRQGQAAAEPYRRLRLVVDEGGVVGPAAGLLAAWSRHPDRPLLVLAADLARVGTNLLDQLVAGRREGGRIATAFRHPSGIPEPLCAIWEAAAYAAVRGASPPNAPSLRRLLETGNAELLEPQWPGQLESINTPEDLAALRDAV